MYLHGAYGKMVRLYGVEARGFIYMVQRPEGVFIWCRGPRVHFKLSLHN